MKNIIVASDASDLGLRTVILHKESYCKVKAIAIAPTSRTLLPAKNGTAKSKKWL